MSGEPPTRKGQEYALKADQALREGKLEEARSYHKHASNAFKEARDSLNEGDTNTKAALNILIDYHRDREKNPGVPRQIPRPKITSPPPVAPNSVTPTPSTSSSVASSPSPTVLALNAIQEVNEFLQPNNEAPPQSTPLITSTPKIVSNEWKKVGGGGATQSVLMGESYFIVPGENTFQNMKAPPSGLSSGTTPLISGSQVTEKLQNTIRTLMIEIERLTRENEQLQKSVIKEREDSKSQKEKFWKMFVLVKSALEESKKNTSNESELKALTRLLHTETEARKRAEQELDLLKRNFS